METEKRRVLIVDDSISNLELMENILSDYNCDLVESAEIALEKIKLKIPDLILLDIELPGIDGYELCKNLKTDIRYKEIPIVFVTAKSGLDDEAYGLELGAVDYIQKPIIPDVVRARVMIHMSMSIMRERLKNQAKILEERVKERTEELARTQAATIKAMASLVETRDNDTGGHIIRTQKYVLILAENIEEFEKEERELLYKSAPLHDIGKVGVPDRILLKPERLNKEEFDEIKKHTLYGKEALERAENELGENSFLRYAKEIAYTHHEKWDGSGYPRGLKGEEIPIAGRLMALADVYDALISKRVYKKAFSHEEAGDIIKLGKGIHFDPNIVDIFIEKEDEFRKIANTYKD